MNRVQQEWAVMAVVFALVSIANGSHLSVLFASLSLVAMIFAADRSKR